MKRIKKLANLIEEEIESAKDYAECYLDYKAKGNTNCANKHKEFSNQEMSHALFIHEIAQSEIAELSRVYTPPIEMQEKWDKTHKKMIEGVAWIRQMLTM